MKYLDLVQEYNTLKGEIDEAIRRVVERGHFILGAEGKALEQELAKYCGVEHAIAVNSGTDALRLSLRALDVTGKEVITTPFTFIATAEMIAECGARPVFVDIDESLNMDPALVPAAVTPKTSAVIAVHLFGLPVDMTSLAGAVGGERSIPVIEDAAQAIGATHGAAKVGALGTAACFSFFPAKNLGAYGDAGMIVTGDGDLAEKMRMLRNHGSRKKYHHEFLGVSSRLDELQAAILRAKLPHVEGWNQQRAETATFYSDELQGINGVLRVPIPTGGRTCVFQQYTVQVERRDELRQYLSERDIPTAVHYPMPLHLQPAFSYLGYAEGSFPNAEKASREVISLPCYPGIPRGDAEAVVDAIRSFYRS